MAPKGAQDDGAIEVHARNVDLAQIEALLLQNRGFSGRLTADATISGSLRSPDGRRQDQVAGGGFQTYKYESLVADVDYADNRITLDATLQQSPGVSITARGTRADERVRGEDGRSRRRNAEDAIDVRVQTAALNLGVVQGFTTAVTEVGGTLEADVRVTGSGRDPHLVGFIDIRDGAFAVPRFGTSYSGLDTRIDFEPDVVRVRRFEILDENGEQLAVAGQLAVHERQVGAVDFTLESENFEIIDNELGDVGVGTNLKITGELARPKLEGEVRIAAGRLEIDRILQLFYDPYRLEALPEVVSAERAAESAGSAQEATRLALVRAGQGIAPVEALPRRHPRRCRRRASMQNVALDLHVRIPDNLVVRGRKLRPGGPTRAALGDINITVGGDLNVRKASGGPITIAGTVNTVRGTYQFQGRQFDLARNGTLRFTGDSELDPILDVTATRKIPDTGVEARVRLTGTLSSPRARALEHAAARRVGRPLTHRLQPADQRAWHRRTHVARGDRGRDRGGLHRHAARGVDWPGARPRPLRDHDRGRGRHAGRRHHDRRADRRSDVPQAAPAVWRAHLQRVPAGVSDRRLPAAGGVGGAGNLRRGESYRPAPHRARGNRSDLFLQLLSRLLALGSRL